MARTPSPTNDIIESFVSTLKRFVNKEVGDNIFQRSYYDHIIRNEKDYVEHYTYIDNNFFKREEDELLNKKEKAKLRLLFLYVLFGLLNYFLRTLTISPTKT